MNETRRRKDLKLEKMFSDWSDFVFLVDSLVSCVFKLGIVLGVWHSRGDPKSADVLVRRSLLLFGCWQFVAVLDLFLPQHHLGLLWGDSRGLLDRIDIWYPFICRIGVSRPNHLFTRHWRPFISCSFNRSFHFRSWWRINYCMILLLLLLLFLLLFCKFFFIDWLIWSCVFYF